MQSAITRAINMQGFHVMEKEFAYCYTKLSDLPNFGRVYVYGVVRSVTDSNFGGQIIKIEDEDGSAIVKVVKKSSKYFYDLQVGNILRLHRTELATLRKLIAQNEPQAEDGSPAQSIRVEESCEESSSKRVTDEPVVVERTPSKRKRSRTDENITNARDIPRLGKQFFNWYALVLGVYTGKGEPFTVFLRVWDGTKPRFPAYRKMFHADKDSIDTVHCDISPSLFAVIEPFTVDVCCYGEWARKALSLRVCHIAECLAAKRKTDFLVFS
ncbi:unnamed protein product [Cylicostephanus goldi]|uniref:Protection of telomeres protein 1 ssDNA-binding domain-containing protein n=1 Tax=Cylicostephanus goldi TaxID=71465 RepID=A0A3P6QJQ6_CYLGO|nr:unnamed protein product [Cylicostephanus goldi]